MWVRACRRGRRCRGGSCRGGVTGTVGGRSREVRLEGARGGAGACGAGGVSRVRVSAGRCGAWGRGEVLYTALETVRGWVGRRFYIGHALYRVVRFSGEGRQVGRQAHTRGQQCLRVGFGSEPMLVGAGSSACAGHGRAGDG